jgi:hypothetical protein
MYDVGIHERYSRGEEKRIRRTRDSSGSSELPI